MKSGHPFASGSKTCAYEEIVHGSYSDSFSPTSVSSLRASLCEFGAWPSTSLREIYEAQGVNPRRRRAAPRAQHSAWGDPTAGYHATRERLVCTWEYLPHRGRSCSGGLDCELKAVHRSPCCLRRECNCGRCDPSHYSMHNTNSS